MPKRTDIKKIMLIGSGPIVIGQGCEFDYSGVQACKVLRREGYEVVLVNSNPATIMTDPEMADRTYIEPLSVDILHEIIRRERPDALLPTLGGQTALNLAMELNERGILDRYQVELIGAKAESIQRAEDRHLFKEAMLKIGLDLPRSGSAHSMSEATAIAHTIGSWPLIIRPGFTLGGTGGGIAHNPEEFETIVNRGLDASLNNEVLIEESLLGWKEFEMEVMRDKKGNAVIVCSIENLDPMGVHTGDSITVAPIQSLDDRAYQAMRDDSLKVMEAIGVETGGSNVQWAIEPKTGRRIIIEMNPRVSRSSALASKATGFPIAKIAALLAVGYTLDELRNDITQTTPSCFEPALDYVVVKVPRFTFEKFPKADSTLGTQMKSVGEAMAIGTNFKQAMQKALRSLETGFGGFGACAKCEKFKEYDDETLAKEVARPSAERIFVLHEALRRKWGVEKLYEITKIDRYFLRHLEELALYEDEILSAGSLEALAKDLPLFRQAKELGYSDIQIGYLFHKTPEEVMAVRKQIGLIPSYYSVDTCAGEFEAITPYYYSCYAENSEPVREIPGHGHKKRIMVLGGGPNRIGQGIEFDYCCCHAAFTLRREGYEVIMVNSNPETVSTDYDTSDKLYFEPLTLEDVMGIYEREKCAGVIVQFGGQTPLNLAMRLKKAGANVVGTSPEDIDLAEDRDFFKQLVDKVGIKQAESGIAHNVEEALAIVEKIGYPVLVRPSFVLGGRGMVIVYKEKYLRKFVEEAAAIGEGKPILIDRFLEDATELDVDCISDGKHTVIGAIMEHVEPLRRLRKRHPAHDALQGNPGQGPRLRQGIREGTPRLRPHEHAARREGRRTLHDRSEPARLPHRAVRVQVHRRPARKLREPLHAGRNSRTDRLHRRSPRALRERQGSSLPVRQVPGCRYHAFSGNEIHRRSHEHRSRPRSCLPQEPAGIGQQGPEPGQHLRLAQGRRQAEGRPAHSPAREPRIRIVRHPRYLYDALQRRHQDPRRVPHLPWSPEPPRPYPR